MACETSGTQGDPAGRPGRLHRAWHPGTSHVRCADPALLQVRGGLAPNHPDSPGFAGEGVLGAFRTLSSLLLPGPVPLGPWQKRVGRCFLVCPSWDGAVVQDRAQGHQGPRWPGLGVKQKLRQLERCLRGRKAKVTTWPEWEVTESHLAPSLWPHLYAVSCAPVHQPRGEVSHPFRPPPHLPWGQKSLGQGFGWGAGRCKPPWGPSPSSA